MACQPWLKAAPSKRLDTLDQRVGLIGQQLRGFGPQMTGGEDLLDLTDVVLKSDDSFSKALLGSCAAGAIAFRDVAGHVLERIDERFVADKCKERCLVSQ